jgi:hypothetical protein
VSSLVLGGKPVLVSNPFVITQLGNSVGWQAGNLETLAGDKYFDLIVLGGTVESYLPESGGWSPQLMQTIGQNYLPTKFFQCRYAEVAYIPTGKSHRSPDVVGHP